jgi:hypothetical protein
MEEQGQLKLFPTTVQEVLSRLSLFPSQAELLYREGLLSFQPLAARTLLPSEQAELVFVGGLAANQPFSLEMIRFFLSSLVPPYAYSHDRMYYDWPGRRWRTFAEKRDCRNEDVPGLRQVQWSEIQDLAGKIFLDGPGDAELRWAEEAWHMVVRGGMAVYANGFERCEVLVRFLALAEMYLEFSRQAWRISRGFDYLAWGQEIGLDLLQVILLTGPEEALDPVEEEEELYVLGLKTLMTRVRPGLMALLKHESGGPKPLFLSLWKISHPEQSLPIPEIFKCLTAAEHEALRWLEQACRNE